MKRNLGILTIGCLALWLVLYYPALLLGGKPAVAFTAVAGIVCLMPMIATLIWAQKAHKGTPEQQLVALFGGTGVRLAFVLGTGMALYYLFPYFHYEGFWISIIVFYLFTLTLEIGLVVTGRAGTEASKNH